MNRAVVIAANWKMNKTLAEAGAFVDRLRADFPDGFTGAGEPEVWIAPVGLHVAEVARRAAGSGVVVATQNAHGASSGAFTGELAAVQAADAGATGAILGHSERRTIFGETDAGVAARLAGVVAAGLKGCVCVGEPLEVREAGKTIELVRSQLEGSLAGFSPEKVGQLRVAYEPVWAIGTGRRAEVPQVEEVHEFIRSWLGERFGYNPGSAVPILYGGSVKPETAPELLAVGDVDGLLVGGASLDPAQFAELIRAGRARARRN